MPTRKARSGEVTNPSVIIVGKVVTRRRLVSNWFEQKPLLGASGRRVDYAREQASGCEPREAALIRRRGHPVPHHIKPPKTHQCRCCRPHLGGSDWPHLHRQRRQMFLGSFDGAVGRRPRRPAGCITARPRQAAGIRWRRARPSCPKLAIIAGKASPKGLSTGHGRKKKSACAQQAQRRYAPKNSARWGAARRCPFIKPWCRRTLLAVEVYPT